MTPFNTKPPRHLSPARQQDAHQGMSPETDRLRDAAWGDLSLGPSNRLDDQLPLETEMWSATQTKGNAIISVLSVAWTTRFRVKAFNEKNQTTPEWARKENHVTEFPDGHRPLALDACRRWTPALQLHWENHWWLMYIKQGAQAHAHVNKHLCLCATELKCFHAFFLGKLIVLDSLWKYSKKRVQLCLS